MQTTKISLASGFSTSALDIFGETILCTARRLAPSSVLLNARSTLPVVTAKNVSKNCQLSQGEGRRAKSQNCPSLRTTGLARLRKKLYYRTSATAAPETWMSSVTLIQKVDMSYCFPSQSQTRPESHVCALAGWEPGKVSSFFY